MQIPFKILLIHNPLSSSRVVTWLSAIIRLATNSHWNHVAIELEVDNSFYILEAVGEGVIITEKDKWLTSYNREVLELSPIHEHTIDIKDILLVIGKSYGYLDLIQIGKYLYKRNVKGQDYIWDGYKGTALWKGWFCSELAAYLMKLEKYHLFMPCDFESLNLLQETDRYFTVKLVKTP
jgi:hypothetical protein